MNSKSFWPSLLHIPENNWDNWTLEEKVINGIEAFYHHRSQLIDKLCDSLQQHLHKQLIDYGFFVPQSSLSIGAVQILAVMLQSGTAQQISAFLCDNLRRQLESDDIFSLRKRWAQNSFFQKRRRFLDRGIEAHIQGDFISSIPVLFPQVEGILVDFLEQTGVWERRPDDCDKALNLMKKILVDDDREMTFTRRDKEAFQRFCDKRRVFHPRPEKDVFLNRGAILHGECLTYDKEEWSAQLIYFLDFLSYFTSCEWEVQNLPDGSPTIQLTKREKDRE